MSDEVADLLPLILLPGMMCDERLWADIPQRIESCCGPILFGSLNESDSIKGMARNILSNAPSRFSLAGLSLGGIVAMEICRQAPHRVGRLALLNTNARADAFSKRPLRELQIQKVRDGMLESVVREELKPTYPAISRDHDQTLKHLVRDMALSLGEVVFERQSVALMNRAEALTFLPEIQCSTLVICGQEDSLCPVEFHAEINHALPNSHLEVLPQCGHLSSLEHPEAVAGLFREWLQHPPVTDQNDSHMNQTGLE